MRATSLKFRSYITAGIYCIVFGYNYLVKSHDLNIELLTVSTDNIWKLCGLEVNDILIQREFNFIGKESNYYTRKEKDIYSKAGY